MSTKVPSRMRCLLCGQGGQALLPNNAVESRAYKYSYGQMLAVGYFVVLLARRAKMEGKLWMESTSDALRGINFRAGARHHNGHCDASETGSFKKRNLIDARSPHV